MHQKLKFAFALSITLGTVLSGVLSANGPAGAEESTAKPTAQGIVDPSGGTAPRLEIRKYRFFHDVKLQRERLVLEFDRRDFYHESKPRVSFEALSSQEILVKVENAVLMGAIPESLINDSYAHQSKFMGPITMDDRSLTSGGLAMKVKLKDFDLGYTAEWLSSPARLVVDVFPKTGPSAKAIASGGRSRQPKSIDIERKAKVPGMGDFVCFPAKAKVNLAVVFHPSQKQVEEIQKFRVNIDGTSLGLNNAVDKESIVCYPKEAQVKAALSFQITDAGGDHGGAHAGGHSAPAAAPLFNFSNSLPNTSAPTAAVSPTAPSGTAPVTGGSDADLDPGPVGGGHNAGNAGGSATPASLLPPLN